MRSDRHNGDVRDRADDQLVDTIAGALERYLLSAAPRLQEAYATDLKLGGAQRLGNLRMAVELEEQTASLRALCSVCLANVTVTGSSLGSSSVTEETWARALGAYLRNSGAYLSVAHSAPVDYHGLAARLVEEAARDESTVTYYAMLEGVDLEADEISWGNYRLVHVDRSSLQDILSMPTRALFFEDPPQDLNRLAHHYFLVASAPMPTGFGGALQRLQRHWSTKQHMHPTDLPEPIEDALATLALYDWQPEWGEDDRAAEVAKQLGWMGFRVPLVLETSDDLLHLPRRIPDTSEVTMTPVPGPRGEEIGQMPERTFLELDAAQTQQLQESMAELQVHRDARASSSSADFLRVAANAVLKALLASGMEQLLWHITAIEAVLGEVREGESTTSLVARRLCSILATTKTARKGLRKQFTELYGFRSALVHGRRPKTDVYRGHLRRARELARPIVVWGLRALAHLQSQAAADASLAPQRKDLLRLADLTEHERKRLTRYAEGIPDGFPHVADWLR